MISIKNITGWFAVSSSQTVNNRRSTCNKCEIRDTKHDVCTACGCVIALKIRLKKSDCPLDFWEK